MQNINLKDLPNNEGFFGKFGGQFVPEKLKNILNEISEVYEKSKNDKDFQNEYKTLLQDYIGRPSPLYFAKNLTNKIGGAKIYLKREDLNHTGAHKINHTLGEADRKSVV